jgi:hypothetical protein
MMGDNDETAPHVMYVLVRNNPPTAEDFAAAQTDKGLECWDDIEQAKQEATERIERGDGPWYIAALELHASRTLELEIDPANMTDYMRARLHELEQRRN